MTNKQNSSPKAATTAAQNNLRANIALILALMALLLIIFFGWNQGWFKPWPRSTTPDAGSLITGDSVSVGILSEGVLLTDVSGVVDLVKPSIVTVSIKTTQVKSNNLGSLDPFALMFGLPGRGLGQLETEEIQQDIGTGFVIESSGLVVTNKHVVSQTGSEYIVIDADNNEHQVTQVYRDPDHDLALLQVEGLTAPALELGDSSVLKVGQGVIAVGTALGEFRQTVTTGVVSGLGRTITAGDAYGRNQETIENIIQTDAAINPGNSGGPLLDYQGRVVGVNVATTGADNISFALPIVMVKESLDVFENTGRFDRPYLGVGYQMISERAALLNEIPQGAYLTSVDEDSAAAAAGLQEGDIITKFGGESLKVGAEEENAATKLTSLINQHKVGDKVEVEYYRLDDAKTTTVTLGKRESN